MAMNGVSEPSNQHIEIPEGFVDSFMSPPSTGFRCLLFLGMIVLGSRCPGMPILAIVAIVYFNHLVLGLTVNDTLAYSFNIILAAPE